MKVSIIRGQMSVDEGQKAVTRILKLEMEDNFFSRAQSCSSLDSMPKGYKVPDKLPHSRDNAVMISSIAGPSH